MHNTITPVIITFNEACNIRRVLEKLNWASEIIVVDSGSADGTVAICEEFNNVRVLMNEFVSPASQFNYGASHATKDWIFALGADYVMTDELVNELGTLAPQSTVNAYIVSFHYSIFGKVLSASLYPSAAMLYRKESASFIQDGHTERLSYLGQPAYLNCRINHDDRKPLRRWLTSQIGYAQLECDKLVAASWRSLGWKNKIRRLVVVSPFLVLVYCLLVKRLILDGYAGWYYTTQRVTAEILLSLTILDHKVRR